jgi:hypothetical protein
VDEPGKGNLEDQRPHGGSVIETPAEWIGNVIAGQNHFFVVKVEGLVAVRAANDGSYASKEENSHRRHSGTPAYFAARTAVYFQNKGGQKATLLAFASS